MIISVHDLAAYILGTRGPMDAMKLQKLLYYCQAWSLAWDDVPLFREHIQAWVEGPVVREAFELHQGDFKVHVHPLGDAGRVVGRAMLVADAVLDFYGVMSGTALSNLSHSEAPWRDARTGLAPTEKGNTEIRPNSMRTFYASLSENAPTQPIETERFAVEFEQEDDGRWIAEVPALPGAMVYGTTRQDAWTKVRQLARKIIKDRVKHGEAPASMLGATFTAA
jgi:uncharacterized phage-associated protein/predicted RNase H-like HicB family nuclease